MEDIAMEVRMLEFKLQILQRTYGTCKFRIFAKLNSYVNMRQLYYP